MTNALPSLAESWYTEVFNEPPPGRKQWRYEVHEQTGKFPLYITDHKNKIIHLYLHSGQRQAWDSARRFVFVISGKQWGKTIYGPHHLKRWIKQYGRGDYLAVSATRDLFIAKMLPELKQFYVTELGIGRYWPVDRILELCDPETGDFGATFSHEHEKMWGRIILRTAESEKGMQSFTAKAAWLDEPGLYDPDVWKDVQGRLNLNEGPVLGTTTIYNLGWLKQQIFDLWVAGDPDIDVISSPSTTNPFFPRAEYDRLKRTMQPWQFRMDYDAEFGRPPAAIYENFIDALREHGGHKVKRFALPTEWPRMQAVDPGVVNPGKGWFAHDPVENVYYCYRAEKGGRRRDAKEHAAEDIELEKKLGERVIWRAIGAKSEKYWREDYQRAGAKNVREPDTMDVEEGIDRVTLLLRQHRLYFMDDLTDLIDEILRYAREIKNGEVTNKIKDKETFHLLDMLRYFAVQVVKPRPNWQTTVGSHKYA